MKTEKKTSFEKNIKVGKLNFYADTFEINTVHDNQSFKNLFFTGCEIKGNSFKNSSFYKLTVKSSVFSNFDFQNSHFQESFGKHYLFENCNFQFASFTNCDFSGGGFTKSNLSNVHFENCDFALCEFNDVNFENSKFFECNFNASFFEKNNFSNCEFEKTLFDYTEGFTLNEIEEMRKKGVKVKPPFEVSVKDFIVSFFLKIPFYFKIIITALIFLFIGYNSQFLLSGLSYFFQADSNPLSHPVKELSHFMHKSYFYNKLSIPNYNFSEKLEHWFFLRADNQDNLNEKDVFLNYEDFSSFPSSVSFNNFKGLVFFIKEKKSSLKVKNVLENPDIWLPTDYKGEKLKFSFYCKYGHPTFSIYGKFINGGYKIISEIDSQMLKNDNKWIYFSEGIYIPAGFSAICLKLSEFPEQTIILDDVNIEKTI